MSSPGHTAASTGSPRRGLAIASLVVGILSIFTFGCLIVGALAGVVMGILALVKANRSPQEYGGKGMAIGGIVSSALGLALVPFVAGILAAIAIPSFLRARISANEAAAIGDVRTVMSAEAAYQSVNAGYYDRLECLSIPYKCIPGYPEDSPAFIDTELPFLQPKSGYRRSFEAGGFVDPNDLPAGASRSSALRFAYVAVPVQPGQTGVRGFCGDASGIICATADGITPLVVDGACDHSACSPLE